MGVNYQRALVLYKQSRPELAEKELRQELADEPDSPHAHALLALCLSDREAHAEATTSAERAISLSPDSDFCYYTLARVIFARNRFAEAAKAIEEAIRLDPENSSYYGLFGAIRFSQRDWNAALEAANTGLQLDPEDTECNNIRAMALVKLGRRAEAGATIGSTLAREPENSVTHANQGWALLEQRDYQKAMEHFREALRLDPHSEWARQGIVEALKARHLIYSVMLSYMLWMSRLSRNVQIALLIGGYLGYRQLWSAAKTYPAYALYIFIAIGLYVAFALLTWLAVPLFNLALRLNRFGRLALSREEIAASNWVGFGLLLTLGWVGTWIATGNEFYATGGLYYGLMLLSLSGVFKAPRGWPRSVMSFYTVGLYALGSYLLWLIWHYSNNISLFTRANARTYSTLQSIYFWGIFLSGWIVNALSMVTVRK